MPHVWRWLASNRLRLLFFSGHRVDPSLVPTYAIIGNTSVALGECALVFVVWLVPSMQGELGDCNFCPSAKRRGAVQLGPSTRSRADAPTCAPCDVDGTSDAWDLACMVDDSAGGKYRPIQGAERRFKRVQT